MVNDSSYPTVTTHIIEGKLEWMADPKNKNEDSTFITDEINFCGYPLPVVVRLDDVFEHWDIWEQRVRVTVETLDDSSPTTITEKEK